MLSELKVKDFLNQLSSNAATPGGGSVAALTAAFSAALLSMVAKLSVGQEKVYEQKLDAIDFEAQILKAEFMSLMDADSEAFEQVMGAFRLPKVTEEEKAKRSRQIQRALKEATLIPMKVAQESVAMFESALWLKENGNKNAQSDALCSAFCAYSAIQGALLNVEINLASIKDEQFKSSLYPEIKAIRNKADRYLNETHTKRQSLKQ